MLLVFGGLMEADDELMRSACDFYREGPYTRFFDKHGSWRQPPVLRHEISSGEPCYSWNLFHSLQLGDRHPFLEGSYSLLTGGMSRQRV